jgi:hypothetical protein
MGERVGSRRAADVAANVASNKAAAERKAEEFLRVWANVTGLSGYVQNLLSHLAGKKGFLPHLLNAVAMIKIWNRRPTFPFGITGPTRRQKSQGSMIPPCRCSGLLRTYRTCYSSVAEPFGATLGYTSGLRSNRQRMYMQPL